MPLQTGDIDTSLVTLAVAPNLKSVAQTLGVQYLQEYCDHVVHGAPPAVDASSEPLSALPPGWKRGAETESYFHLEDDKSMISKMEEVLKHTRSHCTGTFRV